MELIARLNETIDAVEAAYREYQFNTVAQRLYDFVWSDYCDWFVEAAKTEIFGRRRGQKEIRAGSHGFCSFCNVAIAASLHAAHDARSFGRCWALEADSIQFRCATAKIALNDVSDVAGKRELVSAIYEPIQAGRNLRAEAKLPSNRKIRFILRSAMINQVTDHVIDIEPAIECRESGAGSRISSAGRKPGRGYTARRDLSTVAAADRAGEQQRLDKEIARIETESRAAEAKIEEQILRRSCSRSCR